MMGRLWSSLTAILLLVPLFVMADPSRGDMTLRFADDFRAVSNLQSMENIAQCRAFPRVVTWPERGVTF